MNQKSFQSLVSAAWENGLPLGGWVGFVKYRITAFLDKPNLRCEGKPKTFVDKDEEGSREGEI